MMENPSFFFTCLYFNHACFRANVQYLLSITIIETKSFLYEPEAHQDMSNRGYDQNGYPFALCGLLCRPNGFDKKRQRLTFFTHSSNAKQRFCSQIKLAPVGKPIDSAIDAPRYPFKIIFIGQHIQLMLVPEPARHIHAQCLVFCNQMRFA